MNVATAWADEARGPASGEACGPAPGATGRVPWMERWRTLWASLLVVGAMLAAGCAMPVTSEVAVFHEWPADAQRTYRIAVSGEQLHSLEESTYRQRLREELARVGFVESASPRFELRFEPQVTARPVRRVDYVSPSPWFVQPSFYFGSWGRHAGVSIAAPLWGWGPGWGGYAVERQEPWFEYQLHLDMRDLAAGGRTVYEGRAVTYGSSPSIAGAMPYLMRSLFADFPGRSGIARRVEVPRDAVAPVQAVASPYSSTSGAAPATQPNLPSTGSPAASPVSASGVNPAGAAVAPIPGAAAAPRAVPAPTSAPPVGGPPTVTPTFPTR